MNTIGVCRHGLGGDRPDTLAAKLNAATVSNSSDIVCGFVTEKSGGPRPFLYLLSTDEAYIGGYDHAR